MGYSSAVTVDQPNQFASKSYADSLQGYIGTVGSATNRLAITGTAATLTSGGNDIGFLEQDGADAKTL